MSGWTWSVIVLGVIVVGALVAGAPDIARYMKMRRM
jgi:uncharacterized integral membrane protein